MKEKQISIDKFRIIAAILIIAIHTYPLISINETLDFAFTHVFCRIGVPMFLMITGYFILPKAIQDRKQLIKYTIKIAKVYLICMILYLPVNIYAGKLKGIDAIGILKEILINGTFYHLWYFPALILGIWITYLIVKSMKNKKSAIVFFILFVIGLFGDSYYGISEKIDLTKNIYNFIFNIFNYTRNGLFFVPIFIYLGYIMKDKKLNISKMQNLIFIVISIILMILEGLTLYYLKLQRHDSMYIMLIPTMIFIFNLIIQNKNENNRELRNISTMIYILHPIFIIVVRGVAKVVHLENLMIENSVVHFLLVTISTIIFSIIFEKICLERTGIFGHFGTKRNVPNGHGDEER